MTGQQEWLRAEETEEMNKIQTKIKSLLRQFGEKAVEEGWAGLESQTDEKNQSLNL